jgi:hypothetical protein
MRDTQYSGLLRALERQEKQALFDGWANWSGQHPLLATGGYLIPGVGTGLSLADAGRSFSRGNILGGVGNIGMAALGLLPGGGMLGRLLGKGVAKGIGAVGRLGGRGTLAAGAVARGLGNPVVTRTMAGYNNLSRMAAPLQGWKPQLASLGAVIGGGMLEDRRMMTQQGGGVGRQASAQPFDGAGFFQPRQPPGMYRGLREFNPYINGNQLPFGG